MDPRLIDTEKLRREMRLQDRRRRQDPDVDPTMARVWVAYVWMEHKQAWRSRWLLAGFFLGVRRLRIPRLKRVRKRLRIAKDAIVKIVELQHAQRLGPPKEPPSQYNPLIARRWLAEKLRSVS